MSVPAIAFPFYSSTLWNYSINVEFGEKKSKIHFKIPIPLLTTSSLPHTRSLLQKLEPRVLKSRCINTGSLPFYKEVLSTEIAHLFEHILLEYLCQEKIKRGAKSVRFSGWTRWNWKKDERGVFYISITGLTDTEIFTQALARTVVLFDTILASNKKRENKISSKQIELDYLFVPRIHE